MTNEELLRIIDQAAEEEWDTLDLSGQELTELPRAIGKLTKLKTLIIQLFDSIKHNKKTINIDITIEKTLFF